MSKSSITTLPPLSLSISTADVTYQSWPSFSLLELTCMLSCFSHAWVFVAPRTIAHQASVSMGLFQQEYCSGLPFLSPGDLPNSGLEPALLLFLHWQVDPLPLSHLGRPPQSLQRLWFLWSPVKQAARTNWHGLIQMKSSCYLEYTLLNECFMSTTIVMPVPLGTPARPRKYDPFEKQNKLIIIINLSEERTMWQLKILYKTKFILDLYRTYKPFLQVRGYL